MIRPFRPFCPLSPFLLSSLLGWSPNPLAGPVDVAPLLLPVLSYIDSGDAAKERRRPGEAPEDNPFACLVDKEHVVAIIDCGQTFRKIIYVQVLRLNHHLARFIDEA